MNRKNSTSWIRPDARLTESGSLASRFGPREVAAGTGSADVAVGESACGAGMTVAVEAGMVAGGTGVVAAVPTGAQAMPATSRHPATNLRSDLMCSIIYEDASRPPTLTQGCNLSHQNPDAGL